MPRQLRVFLCHASQDKPAVWKLHRYLKQHGISPWLDQADLLPGQDWEVEIPKAIFTSDVILVCLSKNSVNKEGYVQKEIAFALDKAMEKPEGVIFIIPVKLEECDVPKRLSRYQWVDYYKSDGRKRLLMGLSLRAQSLGEEITSIVMDDSKQRTPRSQTSKSEKKEEQKSATPDQPRSSVKQLEQKFSQKKPFTKILDPSSLNPSTVRKNKLQINYRWYGFAGIVLLLFILGGYGLNSLFNKPPEMTSTPTSQLFTETSKPPTETTVPLTSTLTEMPAPSPTPTTVLGVGSTARSLQDNMHLVYVPAGEFTMGSNDGEEDERPVHQVYLDAYWIDQTEVTNAMYAKCVEANQCNPPGIKGSYTQFSYFNNPEFSDYPVIYISWNDALSYCTWAGRTLPTEAQWEKASRGVEGQTYPWGNVDAKESLLNFNSIVGDTTKVGSYPKGVSIYGTLDMAGNVSEWVIDWYSDIYYESSPSSNPLGPDSGKLRVLRGGSWSSSSSEVRSADRNGSNPSVPLVYVGFRCALPRP